MSKFTIGDKVIATAHKGALDAPGSIGHILTIIDPPIQHYLVQFDEFKGVLDDSEKDRKLFFVREDELKLYEG